MTATIRPEHVAIVDAYSGLECTYNGQPARIAGSLNRFATISTGYGCVECSWETVARVMGNPSPSKRGQFK